MAKRMRNSDTRSFPVDHPFCQVPPHHCGVASVVAPRTPQSRRKRASPGFTLIELLVVVSVIALIVALLMPAVQQAREAARKTACRNNLKQIGIAFHSYETSHRVFPKGGAGVVSLTNPAVNTRWTLSWGAAILPHLDQLPLFESINQDETYLHEDNHVPGRTVLPVYLCPTNSHLELFRPNGDTPSSNVQFARTDYGGNYGERGLRCYPDSNCQNNYADTGHPNSGGRGMLLIGTDPVVRLVDVKDGTTHTLMVGEAPEGLHSLWIGHKNVFDQSAPLNAQTDSDSDWQSCHPIFASKPGNFCDYGQEFHSYHSGGANFLAVDGSVKFVSENLDLTIFSALLSRAGGEVIDDF